VIAKSGLGCCVITELKFSIEDVEIPGKVVVVSDTLVTTETDCSDCPVEINVLLSVTCDCEEDAILLAVADDCVELIERVDSWPIVLLTVLELVCGKVDGLSLGGAEVGFVIPAVDGISDDGLVVVDVIGIWVLGFGLV